MTAIATEARERRDATQIAARPEGQGRGPLAASPHRHPLIDPSIVDDLDLSINEPGPDPSEWSVGDWIVLLSGTAIIIAAYLIFSGELPWIV